MEYSYKTKRTCSKQILFEIDDDNKLHNVRFISGCDGNLKGIGKLVEGQDADQISNLLQGVTCGYKSTSCCDQLSRAIKETKTIQKSL